MSRKQAVSVWELINTKFDLIEFKGAFRQLLGTPEASGSWFIYGDSGNGKTTFCLQLAKALTEFDKVEYNTLEEGARASMREALIENNMTQVTRGRFRILNRLSIEDLKKRLRKPRSARIIFIDSVQYTFLNKRGYKDLQKEFPDHLFIWVSHVQGKQPLGTLALAMLYDSDVKIWVEGYKAFSKSRMNRGTVAKPYVIWKEGADEYYSKV